MQRNSRVRFTLHANDINDRQYALELEIKKETRLKISITVDVMNAYLKLVSNS